jgi:predicted permease
MLERPNETGRQLRARITAVSGNYFQSLGVTAAMGRVLTPDDDRTPGAHAVAVISHRFWRRALDRDPRAIGSRVRHNDVSYVILGVTPPSFSGISSNDDPDIWVPMMMANAVVAQELIGAGASSLYVFGRLKPGATLDDANADLTRVLRELRAESAKGEPSRGDAVSMAKGVQTLRARFETPLLVLLAGVGLLLLVACANLAALLLARAAARRDEIALRLSLGASQFRVVRQLLTESLLLGLMGGAAGLVVSAWGASLLVTIVTTSTRRLPIYFTVDARILAFTVGVSVLAVVLFGLAPALQARRTEIAPTSAALPSTRLAGGRFLIVAQMALSLFLLIGAGLFVRSLGNLRNLDTGFAREDVGVLMLDPRVAYGRDIGKYRMLYRDLPGRIAAVPGVRSASMSSAIFFGGNSTRSNVTYEGQPGEAPENEWPLKVGITPGFAETLGLTLVSGRPFTTGDHLTAPKVAIVSESIARRYFADSNPVGKRFSFDSTFEPAKAIEIVGVVRDGRWSSLRQVSPYMVYLPFDQAISERADLQVRTWADPMSVMAQVEQALAAHDPDVRVVHAVTLERLVEDSIIQDRLLALLAGSFGVLALLLSSIGLYGITAYGVHRRTGEIGLRMALGASSGSLQWMVLREVLVLALVGAAVGVSAALAASRVVRALLFEVAPTDPWTILVASTVLVGVAAVASYLPAGRACRIDPVRALRSQH